MLGPIPIHLEPGRYELEVQFGGPWEHEAQALLVDVRLEAGRVYRVQCASRILTAAEVQELLAAGDTGTAEARERALPPNTCIAAFQERKGQQPLLWRIVDKLFTFGDEADAATFVYYEFGLADIGSIRAVANERVLWDKWKVKLLGNFLMPYQEPMWEPYFE